MLRTFFVIFCVLLILSSCTSVKKIAFETDLTRIINKSEVFEDELVGFSLYDPSNDKFLININADKYFTPASNVKAFTFFTTNAILGDSIPSFAYTRRGDSLFVRPLGDPTFLHQDFQEQNAIHRLKQFPDDKIFISYPDIALKPFGPGWAWDDYEYEFQPERHPLPIYGNVISISVSDSLTTISPKFFENFVEIGSQRPAGRMADHNIFYLSEMVPAGDTLERLIPFRTSRELHHQLLSDTLNKTLMEVSGVDYFMSDTIYNGRSLPMYATMMLRSDNFLAEQMLYMSTLEKNRSSIHEHIEELANNELVFLPDSLIWVDGSGLSRYNMITPRNQIALYTRIYRSMEWDRIQLVFPNGGVSGTIKNWYEDEEEPYIFAKTGTLRHNHCLSGFLKTKTGRVLVFSWMNNHYTRPVSDIKVEMQKIFESIRDNY